MDPESGKFGEWDAGHRTQESGKLVSGILDMRTQRAASSVSGMLDMPDPESGKFGDTAGVLAEGVISLHDMRTAPHSSTVLHLQLVRAARVMAQPPVGFHRCVQSWQRWKRRSTRAPKGPPKAFEFPSNLPDSRTGARAVAARDGMVSAHRRLGTSQVPAMRVAGYPGAKSGTRELSERDQTSSGVAGAEEGLHQVTMLHGDAQEAVATG
ncbi:hypothetical protein CYMTET_17086 [Cymbomonas tetramitiformis]|uniref:Uncharacterized protein n=1 Tax=Cymbomonas tetramitiformis TaxID=36881 RepID=A0AAE0L7N3_9CHLO|nr:hypothetical protein CYMTET_17086 [Cymbomonas tetramitiformis]